MAKKKTIDLRSVDPTPVPAGDVNIIYQGTRIGGFSEDTDATLKTGGTRVEHDIAVNYTKPSGASGIPFSFTNNAVTTIVDTIDISAGSIYVLNNNKLINVTAVDLVDQTYSNDMYIAPVYTPEEYYEARILITTDSDTLEVTLNGSPVSYGLGGYTCRICSETYPTEFNITIADKQV